MKGGSHRPSAFGWINHSEDNGETAGEIGGVVVPLTAEVALNVGDVVYASAVTAGNVNKAAVLATTLDRVVGIVVGGQDTDNAVVQDDALIGVKQAAPAGGRVLVAIGGIAKVLADAAIATVNTKVIPSIIVAGRVAAGVTKGQIIGTALQVAAGAASVVRVLINPS